MYAVFYVHWLWHSQNSRFSFFVQSKGCAACKFVRNNTWIPFLEGCCSFQRRHDVLFLYPVVTSRIKMHSLSTSMILDGLRHYLFVRDYIIFLWLHNKLCSCFSSVISEIDVFEVQIRDCWRFYGYLLTCLFILLFVYYLYLHGLSVLSLIYGFSLTL